MATERILYPLAHEAQSARNRGAMRLFAFFIPRLFRPAAQTVPFRVFAILGRLEARELPREERETKRRCAQTIHGQSRVPIRQVAAVAYPIGGGSSSFPRARQPTDPFKSERKFHARAPTSKERRVRRDGNWKEERSSLREDKLETFPFQLARHGSPCCGSPLFPSRVIKSPGESGEASRSRLERQLDLVLDS